MPNLPWQRSRTADRTLTVAQASPKALAQKALLQDLVTELVPVQQQILLSGILRGAFANWDDAAGAKVREIMLAIGDRFRAIDEAFDENGDDRRQPG